MMETKPVDYDLDLIWESVLAIVQPSTRALFVHTMNAFVVGIDHQTVRVCLAVERSNSIENRAKEKRKELETAFSRRLQRSVKVAFRCDPHAINSKRDRLNRSMKKPQGDLFALLGGSEPVKPNLIKSYNLPCFHVVVCIGHTDNMESSGDTLAEAMEPLGGMGALYSLKDDPENDLAFRNLYKKDVKHLKFGDDYGFEIFKDDLAMAKWGGFDSIEDLQEAQRQDAKREVLIRSRIVLGDE